MASTRPGKDACDLLEADHRTAKRLFKAYEDLGGSHAHGLAAQKLALARRICRLLTVHAQIEEELFYPALRAATRVHVLLDGATVEHQTLHELIAQIQRSAGGGDLFDARVRVLGEFLGHHARKERLEIFPRARAARRLDLVALRQQLETRRQELLTEMVEPGELTV
jgi:hemerythrin superfamily protein